ncbi:MAG: hypothetical protein B7733_12540 [Myxococcales bacterium FL481]|nr:MAG: hypothetical protein B7733_12540 [Myxococcales bacterium FL481]
MILTKLWAALLACLATACLAGMFLLSLRSASGFTDADRKVIRAVTEAGIAAIAADIQSSPVSISPSLLNDTRLREALDATAEDEDEDPPSADLPAVLATVANEGLLREHASMSVAIVDKDTRIVARTGIEERLFDELADLDDFKQAREDPKESLFSATLGDRLHTVKVSRRELGDLERRIVAIDPVDLGGGSSLRRVLGTSYPAGLVRSGATLGEPIGSAKASELTTLVAENVDSVPPDGASQVFVVGQGAEARIGAIGRVPGPAGRGRDATVLAVLSLSTAGASQHDLVQSLRQAQQDGLVSQLNWLPLGALLLVALTLCLYFPHLENTVPLRRLIAEFENIGQGRQAQLYQETYNGLFGELARTAVHTHTAIRQAAELGEHEYDEGLDEFGPARPDRPSARPLAQPAHAVAPASHERESSVGSHEDRRDDDQDHSPDEPPSEPAQDSQAPLLAETQADHAALAPLDDPERRRSADEDLQRFLSGPATDEPTAAPPDAAPPTTPPEPTSREEPSGLARFSPPHKPRPEAGEGEDYRDVFEQFVKTKKACGERLDGLTFERFAAKLKHNAKTLSKGDPSVRVRFTVYVKDGVAAIKAKVAKR